MQWQSNGDNIKIMKYFIPDQSKLLSDLGMASESGKWFEHVSEMATSTGVQKANYWRIADGAYRYGFITAFNLSDFIFPSETARKNCKKLWGGLPAWSGDGYMGRPYKGSLGFFQGISWKYHQHCLLDLSEDEAVEEIMQQANKIKQ